MIALMTASLYTLLFGALFSFFTLRSYKLSSITGIFTALTGSAAALSVSVLTLLAGFSDAGSYCGISLIMTPFRSIFLLPVSLIGFVGAMHSIHYIGLSPKHGIPGVYYGAYNLMLFAMMSCVLLQAPFHFLLAWELMGLASFMLVYYDFRNRGVDRSSWIYLLSCEAGGLLLMFSFSRITGGSIPGVAAVICGLLGFGLKAGFPVLHVWLPKAHPAAPAPVSAVMSGAMVNLGIYGLFNFYDLKTSAIGWTLGILGLAGTLTGIMFSLTRRNIKAVLAYSTVENCGIITLGVGCGILGGVYNNAGLEAMGYLGAFMHLINHASLKGALFLGAGSIYHSTDCLDADKLGGLIRKMPSTGKMFTLSSLGLAGVPPFNAFLSELVIYIALFTGLTGSGKLPLSVFCAAGIIVLGASGAFALASLVRISGAVFFGEPRDSGIFEKAQKEKPLMGRAIFIALIPSLMVAVSADSVARFIFEAITFIFSFDSEMYPAVIFRVVNILKPVCRMNCILIGFFLIFNGFSFMLKRRHKLLSGPTWDCGYIKPTSRMQYTSSALVQSITDFFSPIFGISSRRRGAALASEQGSDIADRVFWNFIFRVTARWSEMIHRFQTGYLHFYILVMVISLIAMLIWAFFSGELNIK